jgi:hypothetical protein
VDELLSYVEYLREHATFVPSRQVERSPGDPIVTDPDDEYLVHLAQDAQAARIVSGDPDFRRLSQADTPRELIDALLYAQQEKLLSQIPEYYRVHYSELRSQMERPEVFAEAVPDWMRGYKRVVSVGASDGLVVAHFPRVLEVSIIQEDGTNLQRFPSEPHADDDTYEFIQFPGESVRVLANFIGGGEDIEIGIEPGDPCWGVKGFSRPSSE